MLLFRVSAWVGVWRVACWAALAMGVALLLGGGNSVEAFTRSSHVVKTKQGSLRGLIVRPANAVLKSVALFLGIPYASPPVGRLRFMPPMAPLKWEGVRQAEHLPPVCPQRLPDVTNKHIALQRMPEGRFNYLQRLLPHLTNQSEDCLYLNIYTPLRDDLRPHRSDSMLPVMVYIHGESYEWNSGNPYDGTVLASYGQVIVVTVNFRLGVLGFLRPAIREEFVSNFGILDQIAALHWIRENIGNFGGDPGNVCIFGHGTGAALANLVLISPITQTRTGLFNRAILMSGSAMSKWAVTKNPYKYTRQMAREVDCLGNGLGDDLTQCLQQKSVEELLAVHFDTPGFTTPIGPIIDGIVLKRSPQKSMEEESHIFGKYDLLYGVAQSETYHMLSSTEARLGVSTERRNRLVRTYVSNNFDHYSSQIAFTVLNAYRPWNKSAPENEKEVREQTLKIFSDAQITAPVIRMANAHSNVNQKSFFYVFNHQSVYGDYPMSRGTVRGEELAYVFGAPLVGGFNHFTLNYTLDEVLLSELVMTQWTNFARTGNPNLPTPQRYHTEQATHNWIENMKTLWPPYDSQMQQYLDIDMQVLRKDHYRAQHLAVWNTLIPGLIDTSRIPVPPPIPPPKPTVVFPTFTDPITTKSPPPYNPEPIPTLPNPKPVPNNTTASPPPQAAAGTPISIVIIIGIAIIVVNCCAMGGVYYQRDKIREQTRAIRDSLRLRKKDEADTENADSVNSNPPSPPTPKDKSRKMKKSKGDGENSDVHSDGHSRTGVSRESSIKRKQQNSSTKPETPKGTLKKSSKQGHKRNKSESSIYSEIPKTAVAEVHSEPTAGSSRSLQRKNQSVKFSTVGAGLPPKAVTKSTSSITSKASIRSNTSRNSIKSTASRASVKSTSSEKRLKKNASCQSLPTAEYSWGITPEMTISQRDDPDGRDDQRPPADRHQTVLTMQKLNYPKVLPDRAETGLSATLPKARPPPPPRSTSLTARDIQELEEAVQVVYRKKKPPRRDASTDSGDLSGMDNRYLISAEGAPPSSMYGAPASTATINKASVRKSDGIDYGRTTGNNEYILSGPNPEYNRMGLTSDYGRPPPTTVEYNRQVMNHNNSRYVPYEPTYAYKDGSVGGSRMISPMQQQMVSPMQKQMAPPMQQQIISPMQKQMAPPMQQQMISPMQKQMAPPMQKQMAPPMQQQMIPPMQKHIPTPMHIQHPMQQPTTPHNTPYEEHNTRHSPLATFGKSETHSPVDGTMQQDRSRPTYDSNTTIYQPNTSAIVTAAAHTALATVAAPAFVGASSTTGRGNKDPTSAPSPAPVAAATHTMALRHQTSTTSSSDTNTVYEQSENTGTIKRKKSIKNEQASTKSTATDTDKTYDKPLKSALKQTSAYDKPKPMMAKAPGPSPASTSTSASSLSSTTSNDANSSGNESSKSLLQKTSLGKFATRVATPAVRRKGKQENHTSTPVHADILK